MTFFVGTPDGRGSHDDIASKIAARGQEWARLHWRKEDMASYMYRLVLGKSDPKVVHPSSFVIAKLTHFLLFLRMDTITASRR